MILVHVCIWSKPHAVCGQYTVAAQCTSPVLILPLQLFIFDSPAVLRREPSCLLSSTCTYWEWYCLFLGTETSRFESLYGGKLHALLSWALEGCRVASFNFRFIYCHWKNSATPTEYAGGCCPGLTWAHWWTNRESNPVTSFTVLGRRVPTLLFRDMQLFQATSSLAVDTLCSSGKELTCFYLGWVVIFTSRPRSSRGLKPGTPWIGGCKHPRAGLGVVTKWKTQFYLIKKYTFLSLSFHNPVSNKYSYEIWGFHYGEADGSAHKGRFRPLQPATPTSWTSKYRSDISPWEELLPTGRLALKGFTI